MKTLKTFTKEEADGLIPQIAAQIETLQGLQKKAGWLEVQCELDLMTGTGSSEMLKQVQIYQDQRAGCFSLMHQCIQKIESFGCVLKDIHDGIVDFCSVYEGQLVHLSWRYGEQEVGYMYFSGEDYENRKPIKEVEKKKD